MNKVYSLMNPIAKSLKYDLGVTRDDNPILLSDIYVTNSLVRRIIRVSAAVSVCFSRKLYVLSQRASPVYDRRNVSIFIFFFIYFHIATNLQTENRSK